MNECIKCKYAGDPNDECCKDCNGISMEEVDARGNKYSVPCTECGGYEPCDVEPENNMQNNIAQDEQTAPWNDARGRVANVANAVKAEPKPAPQPTPTNTAPEPVVNAEPTPTTNTMATALNNATSDAVGEILEITAGTGISVEIKGTWYKFDYSEKRSVDPTRPIEEQRKELWGTVFTQVDNAVEDTKNSLI